MDRQIPNSYDPVAAAARLNASLAELLARDKRVRLTAAVGFGALGIAVLFNRYTMIFSPPCFLAAFIALMLYLVARMQLQDVLSRRDAAPTPRVSELGKRRPPQAGAPAMQPKP